MCDEGGSPLHARSPRSRCTDVPHSRSPSLWRRRCRTVLKMLERQPAAARNSCAPAACRRQGLHQQRRRRAPGELAAREAAAVSGAAGRLGAAAARAADRRPRRDRHELHARRRAWPLHPHRRRPYVSRLHGALPAPPPCTRARIRPARALRRAVRLARSPAVAHACVPFDRILPISGTDDISSTCRGPA